MNHNYQTEYYQRIWKRRSGLQMIDKLACLGYDWAASLPKGSALDIGCGDGSNSLQLRKIGFKVTGIDIAENAVSQVLKKGIAAKRIDLNQGPYPFKNDSIRFVWCSEVIEHVYSPDLMMKEISRILKKGGYVYLTTPNVSWYGNRLLILTGKTLLDIHPEHIHWFNRSRLLAIFKKYKLKIEKFSAYRRYLPFPLTQKFSILEKFNNTGESSDLFTYSFAVLARKK